MAEAIHARGGRAHVLDSDALCDTGAISWSAGAEVRIGQGAAAIGLGSVATIWWRRTAGQRTVDPWTPEGRVVNRSALAAITGALTSDPGVRHVDPPLAQSAAENKITQLAAAHAEGLAIPRTLVSNDPAAIRRFAADTPGRLVLKTLRHAPDLALETLALEPAMLADAERLSACPAIYQQRVESGRHARLLLFGRNAHAIELESVHLDWRGRDEGLARCWSAPPSLLADLRRLLDRLGLDMGVVDLMLAPHGPVFLEVNPQGQFLFLADTPGNERLVEAFAGWLMEGR